MIRSCKAARRGSVLAAELGGRKLGICHEEARMSGSQGGQRDRPGAPDRPRHWPKSPAVRKTAARAIGRGLMRSAISHRLPGHQAWASGRSKVIAAARVS